MKNELMQKNTITFAKVKEIIKLLPKESINKWGGVFIVSGFAYLALFQILDNPRVNKAMDLGINYTSSPFGVSITQPKIVTI